MDKLRNLGTFDMIFEIILKQKVSLSGNECHKKYLKKKPVKVGSLVYKKSVIQDLMERTLKKEAGMTFNELLEVAFLDKFGIKPEEFLREVLNRYYPEYMGWSEKNFSRNVRILIEKEEKRIYETKAG